ncbi:MAG: hypothetical protein LBO72_08300 [Helicobacteraceae bacterium]|nr:hypothetical protein [Helicobacteraceae bacterium]
MSHNETLQKETKKPRAPIAIISILIAALIVVIGFAAERAFSYFVGYENPVKRENKPPFVAAGDSTSFFVDANGKVYAAGYNGNGQLGLGDNHPRNVFVGVSFLDDKNIVAIAASSSHSLALDSDGKVYAAGWNGDGALGLGDETESNVWTLVSSLGDNNITAIATNEEHSLALDSEGKVYATGYNSSGQLGSNEARDRNIFAPVSSLDGKKIVAIAAGKEHSLALDSRGKVYATGNGDDNRLGLGDIDNRYIFTPVGSLKAKNIVAIATGDAHSLALDSNGKVYATGTGTYGPGLGFGDYKNRKTFTPVSSLKDKNIVAIATGKEHSLALDGEGKVYVAGYNGSGQLGFGRNSRDTFTTFTVLNDKNIVAIAAGKEHSLALDSEGKLYATGENEEGQLGLGNDDEVYDFTPVSFFSSSAIVGIATGYNHSLALSSDGIVYATGDNKYGQLGFGVVGYRRIFSAVPSLRDKNITRVAAGDFHSLALDSDGKVYATGWNKYGQLGLSDANDRDVFTLVSSLEDKKIVAIVAGERHSLALTSDGKVYATGDNEYGQLGLGDCGDENNRKTFTLVSSLGDNNITAIATGFNHSLALNFSGKLYAAGWNRYDQLGLQIDRFFGSECESGDRNDIDPEEKLYIHSDFTPVSPFSAEKIVAITAGYAHSLALDSGGELYATGHSTSGYFSEERNKLFTRVSLFEDKNIAAIVADNHISFIIDDEGGAYAKGADDYGKLGLNNSDDRNGFTRIPSLEGKKIVAVATGAFHSLAIDADGKLYATGLNEHGALGLGYDEQTLMIETFIPVSLFLR